MGYVVDTHAHADQLTGAPFFKQGYGARTVTGACMGEIQAVFRDIFNPGSDFPVDASQFDLLPDEGDTLFMPDFGSARCDFPGGTAEQRYDGFCGSTDQAR